MRTFVFLMTVALASSAGSAAGSRSRAAGGESGRKAAGKGAEAPMDVDADDLQGQLADLFAGKAADWDTFLLRADILELEKPAAFAQLQDQALDFFVDRFGIYEKRPEVLNLVDRHVLSNLWRAFPGLLDLPLYRRLSDRPSQEELARLLEAYQAALTDKELLEKYPIFDAHFHYFPDYADRNLHSSPEAVIRLLRRYNVVGALASGVPDDSVERLHRLAPDLIAPEIMTNKSMPPHDHARADNYSWHQKSGPAIVAMVKRWIRSELPVVGIGEIHASDVDQGLTSDALRELITLAGDRLFLHLHLDVKDIQKAIEYVFGVNKEARVILAHGGFRGVGAPNPPTAEAIAALFKRHPNLYIDLSAREDLWRDGRLEDRWKKLVLEHPDRVLLGSDPYLRYRWEFYGAILYRMRQWLATLPAEIAADVGYRNGLRLFRRMAGTQ